MTTSVPDFVPNDEDDRENCGKYNEEDVSARFESIARAEADLADLLSGPRDYHLAEDDTLEPGFVPPVPPPLSAPSVPVAAGMAMLGGGIMGTIVVALAGFDNGQLWVGGCLALIGAGIVTLLWAKHTNSGGEDHDPFEPTQWD